MSRPRHYDADQMRESVTDVFARYGYHGTSISMLSAASGLGRQSLYNALGDKPSAFVQALDCAQGRNAAVRVAMSAAPDGLQALRHFFDQAVQRAQSRDPIQHSCIFTLGLMADIGAEPVEKKLRQAWTEFSNLIESTVERGQRDGSIRRDVPAAMLRELLTTLFPGIRVAGRAQPDSRSLRTTVDWALRLLEEGAPSP